MTIYYVDFVNGLDANNGLGPDASHAVNKPWKTIGKALGAAGVSSGDTAYLSPAGPFREVVTVNMTSAVAETFILGDPANAQGFKDGSGVPVAPGPVVWTAYTTNDTTAPSGVVLLNLNTRDFLTFKNLLLVGGTANPTIAAAGSSSVNITFENCAFQSFTGSSSQVMNITCLVSVANNWLFDRCIFSILNSNSANIQFTLPRNAGADYDVNVVFKNSLFLGSCAQFIRIVDTGAGAFFGGGIDVLNCTFYGFGSCLNTAAASLSTSIPCTCYNSVILLGFSTALSATTSGQILEDYNLIVAATPRANVTIGGSSISNLSYAPMVEMGYAQMIGASIRPFLMPMLNSPLLGFGNTGGPSVDFLNRPRPAGGGSVSAGIGYLERHDTGAQETSTVDAGSNAARITGPGDHDLLIPVDAVSTTITVRMRYDANHGIGNKPQATILSGEEIGVTTETKTMTAGIDTWETLTFSAFTPTAKGFITLRLISRAAAGNGIAYFDTITGGANGSQGMDYYRRSEPLPAAVAGSSGGGPGGSHILGGFIVR